VTLRTFSLQRFPGEEAPDLRIEGTIGRRGGTLSIEIGILGSLSEVAFPLPEVPRQRRDRLWEDTCLELFLAEKGSKRYWEFHLSPAGHWNVYRFASYRSERQEESAFSSLPFRVRTEPGALRLSLDLVFGGILPEGKAIEAAVCAVIRAATGGMTCWALAHTGPRPDFHRRTGFRLDIPAM
jgi:hypothetical protein